MNLTKNEKSITIYDVARVSGLSIATVSRVINRTCRVSKSSTLRVIGAIEKLGWTPDKLAVELAKKRA